MLANSVKVVHRLEGSSIVLDTAIIDGPSNRKTIRSSPDSLTGLTIAHQDSAENPGFTTQRSTIRIDQLFSSGDSDATAKGYVQLTTSIPKDLMSQADLAKLLGMLLSLVVNGENAGGSNWSTNDDTALTLAPRIYAGEP
jgi:hypothetical protein